PVVMVTKSEEENIMNKAIGSKIADYLIKPVNPNQVLLSIKKNVMSQQLVSEQSSSDYRSEFGAISQLLGSARKFEDWITIYKKIVSWDMELGGSYDYSIKEVLDSQKNEANNQFAKFIKSSYEDWFKDKVLDKPIMSHTLMRNKVFPLLEKNKKTTFLLIDNFRYDQWCSIRSLTQGSFELTTEDFYCSILPTATQYARNALFAGLTPLAIEKIMPSLWLNDNQDGGKNQYEEEFLKRQMQSLGVNAKLSFDKLIRPEAGKKLLENISKVTSADFSVIIYNFLDILSHARTDTEIIRELADDEAAFRSLTRSWFEHSDLWELMKQLRDKGHTIIITSDHGTVHVDNAVKVIGDKETS
ncbi:MAG: PglZ domain-containing protein, partial [Rikenellaceae bacterium]